MAEIEQLMGIKKWCKEYNANIIEFEELQKTTDEWLKAFDKKSEEKSKEANGVPDEDGWIKVGKRSNRNFVEDKVVPKLKKRRKRELLNFYGFQMRESKMDFVMKLREKFEEDKQKIELLKSRRKFKPF